VSPPEKTRYPEGAPVAVHMNPGTNVSGSAACLSEQGFIDVGFLCPGGEYRQPDGRVWRSGGVVDQRQPNGTECVESLAEVLAFATGRVRSVEGKSIQSYVGTAKALTENAGVIGWSYGGNLSVLAMARHGEQFPSLKWYASWESPILSPVDGGWGSRFEANPFYDPATGKVDFSRLRYSPNMPLWVWPPNLPRRPDWPRGGLYLDGDGNGSFDRNADYGFWVHLDSGPPLKVFYTPLVTREARDRRVFGDEWPHHIATVDEVEERQSHIDALRHIPGAVKKLPGLAILIFESQIGHVTRAADHPHAIAQTSAWLDAHAKWVRFNPDAHYVEAIMGKKPSREIQYPAGRKVSREMIRDLVEPEDNDGGPTDKQGMTAVACELADRTYHNNWAPVLTHVLDLKKAPGSSGR